VQSDYVNVVQGRCRGGAEEELKHRVAGTQVLRFRGAEVQSGCRTGAKVGVVQRC